MTDPVAALAEELTRLHQEACACDDSAAWRKAILFTEREPQVRAWLKARRERSDVAQAVRRQPGYEGPNYAWLSNAKKTRRMFPELFTVDSKTVRYDDAMVVANSRVKEKASLLDRVIAEHPTQRKLRDWVRTEVDGISPIIKPSDLWTFNPPRYGRIDGENGHGYIPGDLYINILWYWAEEGDLVVDVMAGSGMLMHIWERRDEWMPPQWPLSISVELFDLLPRGPYAAWIRQHDARRPLPIRPNLAIADVPYFRGAVRQYSDRADDIANLTTESEWTAAMSEMARALASVQKDSDRVALVAPEWNGFKAGRWMAADVLQKAFEGAGYVLADRACSGRGLQRSTSVNHMGAINRKAKESKVMLAEVAQIMLLCRTEERNRE